MHSIIDLIIAELRQRLEDRSISIEITDEAKDTILNKAYTPAYGARPSRGLFRKLWQSLKKIIQARCR